jgi:hypothetical protein
MKTTTNQLLVVKKIKEPENLNAGYNQIKIADDFITKKQKQFFTALLIKKG